MKNLVSKNPVQRFKQGRKIQFAKDGDKFLYNGEEVIEETLNGQTILRRKNGTYVYPSNRNLTKLNGESYRKVPTAPQTRVFTNTDRYTPMPWKEPKIIEYDNFSNSWYAINTNPNSGVSGVRVDWPNALNYSAQNTQTNQKPQNQDKSNSQKSAKTSFKQQKTNNIFIKGFQNRREEIKDVRAMQDQLIKLGLLKDKFGVDGIWGKNTENAYQKYLRIKFNPQRDAVSDPGYVTSPETSTININDLGNYVKNIDWTKFKLFK